MLHPESSGGTPRSVQDRSPEMLMRQVRSIGRYRDSRNAGGHQSSADDTLLESAGPTQCQSEARGNAPESDLLDAMEFDFTMGDSDPDDVPLEQCVEHPRRRLVLVGVLRIESLEEAGDSDSTATLWGGEDDVGSVVSGIEEPPVGEDILDVDVRVVQLVLREAFRSLGRGGWLPDF